MLHKSITVAAVLALVVMSFAGIATAATVVKDNETFINRTGLPANDIHIQYYSDTVMKLLSAWCDQPGWIETHSSSSGGSVWDITFSWTNPIAPLDSVHVGVEFSQRVKNYLKKRNIYWTFNGNPLPGQGAGPGLRVDPSIGDLASLTYRIINTSGQTLRISNLQLQVRNAEVPLANMMYNTLSGWDAPRPTFALTSGDSADYMISNPFQGNTPQGGSVYLLAQGHVEDATHLPMGNFVQQHAHPMVIPTLTEWGIIILTLLLLAAGGYVVLRKRVTA